MQLRSQFNIDYVKIVDYKIEYNSEFLSMNPSYIAEDTGLQTESAFIVLSLVAKTILGWTIYSQVLIFL